jgi:hypothetical protein
MTLIEGNKHQAARKYMESTMSCWAGLKAILSQRGGFAVLQDAGALNWMMTLLELEPDHVKVLSIHALPLYTCSPSHIESC